MRSLLLCLILFGAPYALYAQCGAPIATFPYNENFELNQGGWSSGGNANDWAWGAPTKPVINGAGTGAKCWVVGGLTTAFYNLGERSYVESPCFDFTNLPHPYIRFKIWWESERRFDGGNLQYSLDQGSTWVNVGAFNDPVDCLNDNWYNYNSITNLNNLVSVRHGWSGNIQATAGSCQGGFGSNGWVIAKHCMPYLAGVPSVKFRFTFGAGTTCNDYDGMAFDDVTIENAPQIAPDFLAVCNGNNTYDFTDLSTNCPDTWVWDFGDPASGGANTSTLKNPSHTYNAPGTYTVKLIAGSQCSGMTQITKTVTILGVTTSSTPVSCFGGTNGTASITVNPGGGNPNFQWNTTPPQTGSTAINLAAGNYTVIVTQANSCPLTTVVFVTQPPALNGSVSPTAATCNQNNGKASVLGAGGTPPYTYAWSSGAGNVGMVTGLAPGNYTVTVTDAKMCTQALNFTINSSAGVSANGSTVQNVSCFNGTNGSITLNPPTGTGPFTYAWPGNISSNLSASALSAGNYTVTISDAIGCTVTTTATVAQPTQLMMTASPQSTTCNQNNGALSIIPSGGTPGYQFAWSPNVSTTASASGLTSGTYTVTLTDNLGCTQAAAFIIPNIGGVTANGSTTQDPACAGASTGSATINVPGGTGPFVYSWPGNISNSNTANQLSAGTYTVTITGTAQCTATVTLTLADPAPLQITGYGQAATCGQTNGFIVLAPNGGTPNYTYTWQPNVSNGNTATALAVGSYTVTVTDSKGCTQTASYAIVNQGGLTSPGFSMQAVTCNGGNNGSASINTPVGSGPFGYAWPGGISSSNTASGLSAGTYVVTISDAFQCTAITSVVVTQPSAFQIQSNSSSATCGNANGSITLSVSGSTPGYIYQWLPNVSTGPSATALAAGVYSITITDAKGCTSVKTAQVGNVPGVSLNGSTITDVSCNGASNGSIVLNAPSGTAPFSYNWTNNVSNGISAANLSAGTYLVTVSDGNQCTATLSFVVQQPPPLLDQPQVQNATCNQNNGSIVPIISGGIQPYVFSWSNGSTGNTQNNLSPGSYKLTITDTKGCSKVFNYTIQNNGGVLATGANTQDATCFGSNTGTASINTPAGTGPFVYAWPGNISNTNAASGLAAGTYIVTITDAGQCTVTVAFDIAQPAPIQAQSAVQNATCNKNNGILTITAAGGTPGYTYIWLPNISNTNTANNLAAGAYTLTINDQNNCKQTFTFQVDATPPPVLSVLKIDDISCAGARDGGITLAVQGGNSPYQFTWSPSVSDTASALGLSAGTYYITVSDGSECIDSISATILAPLPIETRAVGLDVTCAGDKNGKIEIENTMGGVGPFLYRIHNGAFSTNTKFDNLSPGIYILETQDANGCISLDTLQIKDGLSNSVDAGPDTTITLGTQIELFALVQQAATVQHYQWMPLQGSGIVCDTCPYTLATPPGAIVYTIKVTDVNGCVVQDSRRVNIRPGRIFIPNVIDPSSNLENDRFTLYAESGVEQILVLDIFDRWGNLVFENTNFEPNNAQLGWDGRFRDKPVNPGVFTYLFKIRLTNKQESTLTGALTVVR